ncbi:hypothetical protein PGT21_010245 [Puccinia graminis f. sp. tritici]|uniref:Uncharacterized protein n=1 Tax=Puccinia graminis f. sp. tritici TaxID=56615 RepID=A0A5B0P3X5_PUCGR|nr:hypothetical protein PGT21_010245 [Puccinia graminis f. sp. tritici]KAA1099120.1 hypothetical protein PGTUg99_023145 [Puccinia graminis f. sp. tritici]
MTNIRDSRDGRIESGYPRGCGYPLTISAETHIRIRIRIRQRIPASVGGYPRGYPRIPAL